MDHGIFQNLLSQDTLNFWPTKATFFFLLTRIKPQHFSNFINCSLQPQERKPLIQIKFALTLCLFRSRYAKVGFQIVLRSLLLHANLTKQKIIVG